MQKQKRIDEFGYERKIGDPEVLGAENPYTLGSVPVDAIQESEEGRCRHSPCDDGEAVKDPYGEELVDKSEPFVGFISQEDAAPKIVKTPRKGSLMKVGAIAGGVVLGLWVSNKIRKTRRRRSQVIRYPNDLLPKDGARSSVTGGHPEEMNAMPPDIDPNDPNPVYDGSDLTPI